MECGSALANACPSCGTENPPQARFCTQCGTGLTADAAPPAPAPAADEAPPEERRKATIIFADLSGYTAVSERVDPETMKAVVDRALRRLAEEIERYGGSVDKFIGDNVMGVFGAPVSHEDDPERAGRAGLAMQSAMDEINDGAEADLGARFSLRVGINSGEVLAGKVGDGYTVTGDPVNVASRLQAAAAPGSVVVGEITHRLTRAAIEYVELPPMELKGKSEPVLAWEAVRAVVRGRTARSSSPLVGRDEETEILLSLFERVANEGRPHLVTVIGQAGVGKTRLWRELGDRLGMLDPPPAIRIGSCPAYGASLAYWALGEVVRGTFEIVDTDDAETAWRKLSGGIKTLVADADTEESAERLAEILGRPLGIEPPGESNGTDGGDPAQMRDRLFSAVRTLIEAATRRQQLVFAIEDIHWADEGMLDLIEYLARWVRGPVLLVCLARDELIDRRPGWGGGRLSATTITLDPLSRDRARELVGALMPAGGSMVAEIAERSGGNPLFAEEIVNRIAEEGTTDTDALPETVHSVLAARLDALTRPERRVLQHASVVGQTFWEGSLAGVARDENLDLSSALATLQEKDLVVPVAGSRLAGEHEYAFKHALIRDVAYSTLPKAVRARKHAEVGAFISERAADRSEGVIATVAEHYGRAATLGAATDLNADELDSIARRALEALESAGDLAAGLYSNSEALAHYEAAIGIERLELAARARIGEKLGDVALRLGRIDRAVEVWDECMEHHRGEEDLIRIGDLHRKIGAALWNKGDRESSIEHYQRGIDLLKDGPPSIELVRLYEEAASLYMHTGDNMLAIYASEKALRLAERLEEAAAASRAHGIFGRVFGRIGDAERARENLERSVELARETDPAEAVRALLALGYHLEVSEADYEGAATAYGEGLDVSVETGDLPSQVELHAALAGLAVHQGEWDSVAEATDKATELTEREGLAGKLCFPYSLRGILRWHEGEHVEAAEGLERAYELADQVGRSEIAFQSLFWLAAALRDSGKHADADQALARALDLCERAGLVAQSLEATAARAVNLALWGKRDRAAEVAADAARLAERLRYPVGEAASLEARGAASEDAAERERLLGEARERWASLRRPVDAERCAEIGARS
jgi:adenylate cyclase